MTWRRSSRIKPRIIETANELVYGATALLLQVVVRLRHLAGGGVCAGPLGLVGADPASAAAAASASAAAPPNRRPVALGDGGRGSAAAWAVGRPPLRSSPAAPPLSLPGHADTRAEQLTDVGALVLPVGGRVSTPRVSRTSRRRWSPSSHLLRLAPRRAAGTRHLSSPHLVTHVQMATRCRVTTSGAGTAYVGRGPDIVWSAPAGVRRRATPSDAREEPSVDEWRLPGSDESDDAETGVRVRSFAEELRVSLHGFGAGSLTSASHDTFGTNASLRGDAGALEPRDAWASLSVAQRGACEALGTPLNG